VPPVATALPTFLQPESNAAAPESPFVGREAELARLESHLATALAGAGGVVWVTGEAGMGKSALVQRFARRAQAQHEPLVVITGHCNAHTGIGDPYLPFREALALLTGDVEGRLRAGALTATHAAQLWTLLPQTVAALLDIGPDLIGTFLPATPLADRVATLGAQDLLTRLQPLLTQPAPNVPGQEAVPHQRALFEQFTNVLQMLARRQPILLFLDDLQWADIGTISLLFHLGRTIAQDAILIFGAYRPSDVAAGRNGQRHPLEIVIHELQRQYGAIEVALEATDGRRFVEAIVDREPNRLPASFRDTLWAYTQGNALFTV
jgi:predicted ATPase